MEEQKLNWVIMGIVVLVAVWVVSWSSDFYGCNMMSWGRGMAGYWYGNFLGGLVMLLAVIVLALVAAWLFRQITLDSRSKKR